MLRDALRLVQAVGYCGLATVEFLVAEAGYFFIECNPRVQVEHTVTEQVATLREQVAHCHPALEHLLSEQTLHALEHTLSEQTAYCHSHSRLLRMLTVSCEADMFS